ncbi:MAG: glucose-1-phosphate adenylyltransferase [Candidatus Nitrospinota bacterium M3_3B_026]
MNGKSRGETLAIILGGGRGARLYPLTKERCKPAVPLGGKYRLIDVPISNCINSGLRNIYILSQFMSASLNRHVSRTYQLDAFSGGFVGILAATQTHKRAEDWFQGTADAVRKCLEMAHLPRYRRVVILSGDQLYKMDYRRLLATHEESGADITISVLPVGRESVSGFGVMRIDGEGRIVDFVEKPKDDEVIEKYRISDAFAREKGVQDRDRRWLASMGIYVFDVPVLLDILRDESQIDFGKDVIPSSLSRHRTMAHLFEGYWEDIGTIKSFFDANIALGERKEPLFDFHGREENKIFTEQRFLMASRLLDASVSKSVISDGCFFDEGARIERSVIGIRSRIGRNADISEAVIMGADYYERPAGEDGLPELGIGDNGAIRRAILDKNVVVGDGARIVNERGLQEADGELYHIRDGIVIIPKNTIIPPGTVI